MFDGLSTRFESSTLGKIHNIRDSTTAKLVHLLPEWTNNSLYSNLCLNLIPLGSKLMVYFGIIFIHICDGSATPVLVARRHTAGFHPHCCHYCTPNLVYLRSFWKKKAEKFQCVDPFHNLARCRKEMSRSR